MSQIKKTIDEIGIEIEIIKKNGEKKKTKTIIEEKEGHKAKAFFDIEEYIEEGDYIVRKEQKFLVKEVLRFEVGGQLKDANHLEVILEKIK